MKEKDLFNINLQLFAEGDVEKTNEEILKEALAQAEENFKKLLEEKEAKYKEDLEKINKEKEDAILAGKSEKDKAEYLANQARLNEEKRVQEILEENERLKKEKSEKEEALKAKEEKDRLLDIIANKPYLADKIKTVNTVSQYETFIKPFEDDLKIAYEAKIKDRERNGNVFKGINTSNDTVDFKTKVAEILANRKK